MKTLLMKTLKLDPETTSSWFKRRKGTQEFLYFVPRKIVAAWNSDLSEAFRRCYISDFQLAKRAKELIKEEEDWELDEAQINLLESLIPDPGSVMSGDFGEILGYIFLASKAHPAQAIGPKKWRLKNDRKKASPYSDIVQFILPDWPEPSEEDQILCAEVKAKATKGKFRPIQKAFEGSVSDRKDRLAKTLAWLEERSLKEPIEGVKRGQIQRFIKADKHPEYSKDFYAIAVVCASLVDDEIRDAEDFYVDGINLRVITVPDLKTTYTRAYQGLVECLLDLEERDA